MSPNSKSTNPKFSFGENWKKFLSNLDEERFKEAENSLTEFMGVDTLSGKSFLDIGCGSGLFSRAAYHLEAKKVVSFDLDPMSVECCRFLLEKSGDPENWEVCRGSVLDPDFIGRFQPFDIVYSWGVLHHTGKMWDAIKSAGSLVADDGFFYIAIYNKSGGLNSSYFWLKIKKLYNQMPETGKWILEKLYLIFFYTANFMRFRNPFSIARSYKSKRGMNLKTDIVDWLGGYPYEFATPDEITGFMSSNFPDFRLINIKSTTGTGCNWFLFQKHR